MTARWSPLECQQFRSCSKFTTPSVGLHLYRQTVTPKRNASVNLQKSCSVVNKLVWSKYVTASLDDVYISRGVSQREQN